jgi:hypothetical protein
MNAHIPAIPGEPDSPPVLLSTTVLPAPRRGSAPASRELVAHWVGPGDALLDQVGAVLEDRFAADERDDWDTLLSRHRAGRFLVAVAGSDEEPVAGVAVVALLPRTGSAALLYLATHRDASVPGVGLCLMLFLREHLPAHGVTHGFLGEVERVEDTADPVESVVRRRRLAYYRRFGCRVVDRVPGYGMPDMTSGTLLPLHLVWLPAQTPLDDVGATLLTDLVTELYDVAYDRPADDALLRSVLASIDHASHGTDGLPWEIGPQRTGTD